MLDLCTYLGVKENEEFKLKKEIEILNAKINSFN